MPLLYAGCHCKHISNNSNNNTSITTTTTTTATTTTTTTTTTPTNDNHENYNRGAFIPPRDLLWPHVPFLRLRRTLADRLDQRSILLVLIILIISTRFQRPQRDHEFVHGNAYNSSRHICLHCIILLSGRWLTDRLDIETPQDSSTMHDWRTENVTHVCALISLRNKYREHLETGRANLRRQGNPYHIRDFELVIDTGEEEVAVSDPSGMWCRPAGYYEQAVHFSRKPQPSRDSSQPLVSGRPVRLPPIPRPEPRLLPLPVCDSLESVCC